MTPQELAHEIAILPVEDYEETANLAIEEIEANGPASRVQAVFEVLLSIGIDVTGLCKKKHPA